MEYQSHYRNKWYYLNHRKRCPYKTKWGKFKGCAKKMNYTVEYGYAHWLFLIRQPCYVCGCAATLRQFGIDRFDNSQHYTVENSRPCCWFCNKMKSRHDIDVFLAKVEQIHDFQAQERRIKAAVNSLKDLDECDFQ